jgi:putative transposase
MRRARCKADKDSGGGFYHCISRVVNRDFIFGDEEKEHFLKLMRGYEAFCGIQIVTFCVMSNHFHILLHETPRPERPEDLPSDKELVARVRRADCHYDAATLKADLKRLRAQGAHAVAEQLRERFFCRMWDVSAFMKVLKQRFSQWYNRRAHREGTLWQERFKSVLVEGPGPSLATIAAYIDLNPVRANLVKDPAQYRWSGYAQAMAGYRIAREGLRVAVEALGGGGGKARSLSEVMGDYRLYLYCAGEAVAEGFSADGHCPERRGFNREEIDAVLAKGGRISLAQALRCRVRYFCDGAVLGRREFVEAFFAAHPGHFGRTRRSGARPLRGIQAGELRILRALRVRRFG